MDYVTLSEQGLILQANLGSAALLGASREMLVKQPMSRFILKEDQHIYDLHCKQPGRVQSFELRMAKYDGTPFWAHLTATAVLDEFGPPTLRLVLTNIPAKKRAHEIHQAIAMQRELKHTVVANTGNRPRSIDQDLHADLRQRPLAFSFLAKTLEQQSSCVDGKAAEPAASTARQMQDAAAEGKNLVQGLAPVELEPGGLTAALRKLAARNEALFGITCGFECNQEVPVHDLAQSLNLYRIAQEASGNAIGHGGAQRVQIALSCDAGKLRLSICDNGSGFTVTEPNAKQPRGMGVKTMRFRASLIGADLKFLTSAEGEAEVLVEIESRMAPPDVVDREVIPAAASGGRRN